MNIQLYLVSRHVHAAATPAPRSSTPAANRACAQLRHTGSHLPASFICAPATNHGKYARKRCRLKKCDASVYPASIPTRNIMGTTASRRSIMTCSYVNRQFMRQKRYHRCAKGSQNPHDSLVNLPYHATHPLVMYPSRSLSVRYASVYHTPYSSWNRRYWNTTLLKRVRARCTVLGLERYPEMNTNVGIGIAPSHHMMKVTMRSLSYASR
mmetsp:Transcript_24705/g.84504  ORF Transcript_24705/g.84504 Transcript_24705/m.84504 type:complete len:210 (+) Transcript_24705:114-743(+)